MSIMSTTSRIMRRRDRGRPVVLGGLALLVSVAFASPAFAIPPPDVIVNAGMQIAQAIGVAAFFCSTGIAYFFRRFRAALDAPWKKAAATFLVFGGFALSWYLLWGF